MVSLIVIFPFERFRFFSNNLTNVESTEFEGDIVHFSVLGKHIIVLNSYAAAYDLLLRRSAIYSDRPRLPMVGELYEDNHCGASDFNLIM